MTDLYSRILLWHKLLAMQTGSLALCSAKHRLNRDEARGWADAARNVADDIETFLETGAFVLDDRGARVVSSVSEDEDQLSKRAREVQDVATQTTPSHSGTHSEAVGRKSGGLRVARRKTK